MTEIEIGAGKEPPELEPGGLLSGGSESVPQAGAPRGKVVPSPTADALRPEALASSSGSSPTSPDRESEFSAPAADDCAALASGDDERSSRGGDFCR